MPAGNTYVEIANQTLTSAASSVTFSSIPSSYTDLVLVVNARSSWSTDSFDGLNFQFNGDTGSNYSDTTLFGRGGGAYGSYRNSNQPQIQTRINTSDASNTTPSTTVISIQNYTNATTFKTVLINTGATAEYYSLTSTVGLWRSTSIINSIKLYPGQSGSQFVTGSTFALYGIAAA